MTGRSTTTLTEARLRKAGRRAERLDDPRFEALRSRPARRRLTVGLIALVVVETVLLGAFALAPTPVAAVALGAGVAVVVAAFVLLLGALKASTRGVEELPPAVLDERELAVRGDVYVRAYRTGASLLTLLLVAVVGALWAGWSLPEELVVTAAVVTFHVSLVLPTLVAAWTAD